MPHVDCQAMHAVDPWLAGRTALALFGSAPALRAATACEGSLFNTDMSSSSCAAPMSMSSATAEALAAADAAAAGASTAWERVAGDGEATDAMMVVVDGGCVHGCSVLAER